MPCKTKLYPTFTGHKEPSIYYFTKKITLHLLGVVVDEGEKVGKTYVYDQRIGQTNSNHIISALYDMIKN